MSDFQFFPQIRATQEDLRAKQLENQQREENLKQMGVQRSMMQDQRNLKLEQDMKAARDQAVGELILGTASGVGSGTRRLVANVTKFYPESGAVDAKLVPDPLNPKGQSLVLLDADGQVAHFDIPGPRGEQATQPARNPIPVFQRPGTVPGTVLQEGAVGQPQPPGSARTTAGASGAPLVFDSQARAKLFAAYERANRDKLEPIGQFGALRGSERVEPTITPEIAATREGDLYQSKGRPVPGATLGVPSYKRPIQPKPPEYGMDVSPEGRVTTMNKQTGVWRQGGGGERKTGWGAMKEAERQSILRYGVGNLAGIYGGTYDATMDRMVKPPTDKKAFTMANQYYGELVRRGVNQEDALKEASDTADAAVAAGATSVKSYLEKRKQAGGSGTPNRTNRQWVDRGKALDKFFTEP